MTDKEWYALLSTLVLNGIDQVNKGQSTWDNQYKIKDFVCNGVTPEGRKASNRRIVFLNVSEVMNYVGYVCGFVFFDHSFS